MYKWTAQSKTDEGTGTIPGPAETEARLPPATVENGLQQSPRAPPQQPTTADGNRRDNNKRKHHPSSSAEEGAVSTSSTPANTIAAAATNEEEETETEEEQVTDKGHKRRRLATSESNNRRHALPPAEKDKRPQQQRRRSHPLTTTKKRVPRHHTRDAGRTSTTNRSTLRRRDDDDDDDDDEEEEEEEEEENKDKEEQQQEEEEETEKEDTTQRPPRTPLKNLQKLRAPFRPPQHLRNKPCVSRDGGKTWSAIPWNKKHSLPGGDAWIQPMKEFFRSTRELEALKEEDKNQVPWRQDFEYCYGVHWPVRHLGAFMANEEVEASVSHRDTSKEGTRGGNAVLSISIDNPKSVYPIGRHLVLNKSGDIKGFPSRKALVERLNKEWASELGKGNVFNAVQSNLYSGNLGLPDGVSSSSTPDHINFHKDGRCKKRGPPIVSGCYSNVPSERQEDVVAAFLIHSEDPDQGLRVWIPQVSGTGYAFGGKHCHKRYYHGKFLWGDWRAYRHHVSITFSCYHSWRKKGTEDPQQQQRGVKVSVDWNLTGGARLWSRRYLLGQVPKSACHPDVCQINQDCIVTSNYESVWGPWDEFKNTSILQLLQLHPADGGQGIAGNRDHALSLLIMGGDKYSNRVVMRENSTLRVEYYASDKGKTRLLKRAKKDHILVRVFLSPAVPARASLFVGCPTAVLFLPLMIVDSKGKDIDGVFFVLSAQLSIADHYKLKPAV